MWYRVLVIQEESSPKETVVEIRMIDRCTGYTRLDRIRKEMISEKVRVVYIENEMKETTLRWFDYIKKEEYKCTNEEVRDD